MAKKKAKAGRTKRAKISKKKIARKKVAKKKVARAAKRGMKAAKKKAARKLSVKVAKKVVKKAAKPKAAARPKLARRTKQALPPSPVVVAEAVRPAPAPFAAPPLEAEVMRAGPAVGDLAPDFALPDQNGQMHTLAQYRGRRVVLYFYPKDDTPGCTAEACGFRDQLGRFTDHNVALLGVSPDSVESHQRFNQKYGLTFPLLADEHHAVAEKYGVWVEKDRLGQKTMGIARTTFIIDAAGRIAHVFRDVHAEGHEQEVLTHLSA